MDDVDEEPIDYFGDYTANTIDDDIVSGPLYKPNTSHSPHTNPVSDGDGGGLYQSFFSHPRDRYSRSKYNHSRSKIS